MHILSHPSQLYFRPLAPYRISLLYQY
jgi:hypothetical protein